MPYELDMEALKRQILERAIENLQDQDDRYTQGWIEGVLFACELIAEIWRQKQMLIQLEHMPSDKLLN